MLLQMNNVRHKYKRFIGLLLMLSMISVGILLIIKTFNENIMFFYSPTDIVLHKRHFTRDQPIRVGGVVKTDSLKQDGLYYQFVITDYAHELKVEYSGMLPNLFKEGQGVVALGEFNQDNSFIAKELLAKHDENYMPPEIKLQPTARVRLTSQDDSNLR
jgi:cytochrome c-type biogenesis protein CcmE